MKIKEILLGIIISIIFLMFCVFGMKLIYDTPEYEDYCDYEKLNSINTTTNYSDYQEMSQQCSEGYDLAEKNYSKICL
jgi:hypothetical protein